MSDFDDLMSVADADIMDVFGDAAVLNDGATDYPIQADIEKGVAFFAPDGTFVENHISINIPPVNLAIGHTVTFTASGEVYTLRKERSDDGLMAVWASTLNA